MNTVICFAERKTSSDSDSGTDTQVALGKLYAHVQMMPNSSKKKKLLKRFNQASGTHPQKKHSRSKTLGEQIKVKFMETLNQKPSIMKYIPCQKNNIYMIL